MKITYGKKSPSHQRSSGSCHLVTSYIAVEIEVMKIMYRKKKKSMSSKWTHCHAAVLDIEQVDIPEVEEDDVVEMILVLGQQVEVGY